MLERKRREEEEERREREEPSACSCSPSFSSYPSNIPMEQVMEERPLPLEEKKNMFARRRRT